MRKKYFISEKYIPVVLKILENVGYSIDEIGNESAIFFGNTMRGIIEPPGIVTIDTNNKSILSELSTYDRLSKKCDYGE